MKVVKKNLLHCLTNIFKVFMCSDDVCVLSASGTAAVVNVRSSTAPPPVSSDTPEPAPANPPLKQNNNMTSSLDRTEFERQGSLTQSTPLKSEVSFTFLP